MGLADAFGKEDRVSLTISGFCSLTKFAVKSELLMNAINCNVPHRYIREMATGNSEESTRNLLTEKNHEETTE